MRNAVKLGLVLLTLSGAIHAKQATVRLSIDPTTVVNRVDEKVYGHFLEHIYHSCNGGLWGELVWNRSFEETSGGRWRIEEGQVVQEGMGTDQRLVFGDPAWTDYEFTLEAQKTGGAEGFLILFRVASRGRFYWYNIGGWGNVRHQLEKGTGRQWGPVGPGVRDRIETGKWYRIRVRCEGNHIQIWLDDRQVLDYTDAQSPHLAGQAGVGTWATQATFRNLKVASLDGKVLFEGLPPALERVFEAGHWRVFGLGQASVERDNAFNSNSCVRIRSSAGETGLEQDEFCIRAGETYEGSLWACGPASGGLAVRLISDGQIVARQALGAVSADWRELKFELRPQVSDANAVLQVVVVAKAELAIDQVSMMPRSWKAKGGFRPELLQAIAALRPPVIRWPGGCFASSYQWKQGIGPQHERLPHPREIWDDLDVYSFGTDEFVEMCRRVGAEPLIVVNIGSRAWNNEAETHDYTQDILDWIEYCNGSADCKWGKVRAANGHPEPYNVKYWEIDNETWHTPAGAYAEQVLRIAPLMKKADPSIKLAACGSGGMGRRDRNGMLYNRTVIERCAEVLDYISIHHYENPNRFAQGPRDYEAFFREIGELIAKSGNAKLKIYVSEWNAQSTDWRTGLYCGGLLNAFERCGDILEMGGPALFLRHVSATAWDNAFINFDQSAWFPAPNYVVMKLWRDHYAPEHVELSGDTGPLNVVATRRDTGGTVIVKVVNPTTGEVPVDVSLASGLRPVAGKALMVAPGGLDVRNTLSQSDRVDVRNLATRLDGDNILFDMPALSAAAVTIKAGKSQ